jgi:hypothetical protein
MAEFRDGGFQQATLHGIVIDYEYGSGHGLVNQLVFICTVS